MTRQTHTKIVDILLSSHFNFINTEHEDMLSLVDSNKYYAAIIKQYGGKRNQMHQISILCDVTDEYFLHHPLLLCGSAFMYNVCSVPFLRLNYFQLVFNYIQLDALAHSRTINDLHLKNKQNKDQ
jgi:hypothetical protein